MKTFYRLLVACLFLATPGAFAQTYSYTGGNTTNVYPLSSTTNNRTQFLLTPADLGSPPAGNITKLYFMSASAANGTGSFTDLTVRMGTTTATALVTGPFLTNVTTVYTAPTTPIPLLAANDWFLITLQTPFFYNGIDNIIIDISQLGYTASGLSTKQNTTVGTGGGYRLYGSASGTTGTAGVATANLGFDYGGLPCVTAPTAPANGGAVCLASPTATTTTTLSWPAVTGATGYNVYLNTGSTATTLVSTNQPGTTFTTTVAAGPYAWKVVPRDTGLAVGCASFTFTATPNVTSSVTIALATMGAVCGGRSVTYTATPTNGGTAPAYQWKKGTVNVGINSSTYTDTNPIPGDAISVVMTSNAPCSSPASVTSNVITPNILPSPTAIVGPLGAVSFCTGSSVSLVSNTNIGYTYQWQLNNTNIAGATNSVYNVSAAGNYRVIVSTGSCKDTSLTKTVTVDTPPPASTISSVGTTFCQGAAITLTGPAPAAGITYQWLLNGNVITGATGSTYAANTAGNYRLKLSRGSCVDTSAVKTITVNPPIVATATAASATGFCTGGSVVLNANTGTGLTYQWRLNGVAIPGATSAAYTATAAGSYSVAVSNGTCSNNSNAIGVTVSALAAPTVSAVGASTFCLGDSVTLQSSTAPGYTYQWFRNNTLIAGATTSTLQAVAAGNYSVAVSDGTCTVSSTGLAVTITPTPPAETTPSGSTSTCFGSGVAINANTGSGYAYQWMFNGNPINGANRDIFTAYLPGSYSVIVYNGTCPAVSAPVVVTAKPLPVPVITVSGTGNMSTGTFVTYQWYLNGGLIPGATSQNYTATRVGDYYVIVTDASGCAGTSAVQSIAVASVNNVTANAAGVKLYPNPVENLLNVEASRAVNITITSIDGKKLMTAENAKSVDLSHLAQGLYLIRVSDAVTGALILVDKVNKR